MSLSISSTPGSVVTFRAVQTNPALDAQAIVLATDSANHTCTVPVSFHVRSLGPANNEAICNLAELYSLDVVSVAGSPSLPAGTTVCSSHLANCPGGLPGGYTFLNDSRILTVRSPIAGLADMKLTRTGTYDDHLRLMFSRSTDSGANFTALEDVTTDVSPGSSVIRGKGQWSDVKVIAARIGCIAPAVSEWGVIVLSLLMMTALAILVTRRRLVPAGSGMQVDAPSLFVPRVFAGALAGTEALAVVALSASWFLGFSSTPTDVVGSLVSAGIVAYLVHLWRVLSYSSRRTG